MVVNSVIVCATVTGVLFAFGWDAAGVRRWLRAMLWGLLATLFYGVAALGLAALT